MPASVVGASPATVLPAYIASAFQHSREWAVDQNRYLNGEAQSVALVATSRKRWNQTQILTAAQYSGLITFYLARRGPTEEFWFYDVNETSPVFSYDATGSATTGRYAVRFEGNLSLTLNMPRSDGQVAIVEVS